MTVIDRTPNTTSYKSLGEKVMLDLEDSLDLIDLALHTKDDEQLLQFLEALSIRMRDIKTIFRIYWEKSKNIPERNIEEIGKPEKPSVLSDKRRQGQDPEEIQALNFSNSSGI